MRIPESLAEAVYAALTDSDIMLEALRRLASSLFASVSLESLTCAENEYVALIQGPGGVEYEACRTLTMCEAGEYEARQPTRLFDRVCEPITTCVLGVTFQVRRAVGVRENNERAFVYL